MLFRRPSFYYSPCCLPQQTHFSSPRLTECVCVVCQPAPVRGEKVDGPLRPVCIHLLRADRVSAQANRWRRHCRRRRRWHAWLLLRLFLIPYLIPQPLCSGRLPMMMVGLGRNDARVRWENSTLARRSRSSYAVDASVMPSTSATPTWRNAIR